MNAKKYGALDRFRLAAALLVICIHTSPFASFSEDADFFLTRIAARLAVPFFLMTTGFFTDLSRLENLRKPLVKAILLYGISTALYAPIAVYSGRRFDFQGILKAVIFDGVYYHLWYFPALIAGLVIVYFLKKLPARYALAIAGILYIFGLFGDSYFGASDLVSLARALCRLLFGGGDLGAFDFLPSARGLYMALFRVFDYTRNGLFYAPIFLLLGNLQREKTPCGGRAVCEFGIFFSLMIAEAFLLRNAGFPRHDSMYIFLIPTSAALFRFLLSLERKPRPIFRGISMWVYIIHPLVIAVLHAFIRRFFGENIFEKNSFLAFAAVSAISFAVGYAAEKAISLLMKKNQKSPTARAWAELNISALENNVRVLSSLLPEGAKLMPAVKANAYGHGAVELCRRLNVLGVDAFCVACAEEGAELRRGGIKGEILVLGYTAPEEFYLLKKYCLAQTVVDPEYAKKLRGAGNYHVHVGIDTGMHRLGIPWDNFEETAEIFLSGGLIADGIFTHFAAADSPDGRDLTQVQAARFRQVVKGLNELGFFPKKHLQSSFGLLNYPELEGDLARVGIALYGCVDGAGLLPVLSLKARVASVRDVRRGETIGYGTDFLAAEDMKIAALTIGYADGLPRALSDGKGHVLINGKRAPIAGKICMDQTLVDVSGIDVRQGDTAVIIGSSGGEVISVCELARLAGMIPNEILSGIGGRVKRFFAE